MNYFCHFSSFVVLKHIILMIDKKITIPIFEAFSVFPFHFSLFHMHVHRFQTCWRGEKPKWNSFYLQLEVSGSFVSGLLLLGFLFPTINKISDLPYVMKKPVVYHYKYTPPQKKVALILDSLLNKYSFMRKRFQTRFFCVFTFQNLNLWGDYKVVYL